MNDSTQSQQKQRKLLIAILIPVFAFGLLVILMRYMDSVIEYPTWDNSEPTSTTNLSTPTPKSTAEAISRALQDSLQNAPTPVIRGTPTIPKAEIIARVNGKIISIETLMGIKSIDRAMTALLSNSTPSGDNLLERLINTELVLQEALTAGFATVEKEVIKTLDDMLSSNDLTQSDLETALEAEGSTLDSFIEYFGHILLVDQYSHEQADSQGLTHIEYLDNLQRESRISFGPASASLIDELDTYEEEPLSTTEPGTPEPTPIDEPRGVKKGQLAPEFNLLALNNDQRTNLTLDDLSGKPVLLSFWTTWCPYCRAQTPHLIEAFGLYNEQVQFVGINVKEKTEDVQKFIDKHNIPYTILLDLGGETAKEYRITGYPTTYFLDADGRVVDRHIGALGIRKVEPFLQRLIATPSP